MIAWLRSLFAWARKPRLAPAQPATLPAGGVRLGGMRRLRGDGNWPHLRVYVHGEDLIITAATVTAFGGADDAVDGRFAGATASGKVNTVKQPGFIGCALPMRRDSSVNLAGSPIPRIPWMTPVEFEDTLTGRVLTARLIDEGPARWTKKGADLTVAAARVFNPQATANNFLRVMNVRIPGGARYVTEDAA